ncbi:MAG: hypothetical protein AABM67_15985 [Acidobacteriota bacterium]
MGSPMLIVIISCLLSILSNPCVGSQQIAPQPEAAQADEPRFTSPPAEESATIKNLIDQAQTNLASGKATPLNLLTDPAFMSAHEWPRFRKLIRDNAKDNQLTIVTPQEPGDSLLVSGLVRDKQGQPLKGALIYVYQTSAKGWYSDKAPHISGNSGDERHARLFGYLKANQAGQFEFRTIRPAGYPRSDLPAHIHIEIATAGAESYSLISEILFDDDPRLTPEMRERATHERFLISKVERGSGGQRVKVDFQVMQ